MALLSYKRGEYREAISWSEQGLELYPDDLSMIKNLALAYSRLLQENATPEELHKGLEAMRRAVEAAPSDPVPSLNLAVVLARFYVASSRFVVNKDAKI